MNVTEFTYLLAHPQKVTNGEQTMHLEDIIREYPYFQAARALHLKGLKNQNSYKYNKALKATAAYTADREVLFEYITSKDFAQPLRETKEGPQKAEAQEREIRAEREVGQEKAMRPEEDTGPDAEVQPETAHVPKKEVLPNLESVPAKETVESIEKHLIEPSEDRPLPQDEKDAEQILDPNLFEQKEAEEKLEMGKPLPFNKEEKHSFAQWLQLASKEPIDRGHGNTPKTMGNKKGDGQDRENVKKTISDKFARIDRFIAQNPKIVPKEDTGTATPIPDTVKFNKNELMTETLARVYLEQKKYKQAIQAYKILSLKYPEKSGFFADRIKAVEQIKKDNKQAT